jgi:glycosyltransferase involved in cell wall biosynthesis
MAAWRAWRAELAQTPAQSEALGYRVYYPHYTSPPHHLTHALWGFWAYPAVSSLLRRLYAEQRFDLIHAHYGTPAGVVGLLARRWMGIPVVISVHGLDVTYTARQNRLGAAITGWALRSADGVLANSSWTARRIEHYAGAVTPQIVYLGGNRPPGLEPPPPEPGRPLTVLSVGHVELRKGQLEMIRAVGHLRDEGYRLRYVVVGTGSYYEQARRLAAELGLADVVAFEGPKAHADVWPYFASCDIFALPSWDEAFGVVYIEALGLGKPVIGCVGEGGMEDLRRMGDCVELVRPRDVADLVACLRRLIDDPERRQRMGAIGRAIVAERFTWERNAAETYAIYRRLLEGGRYAPAGLSAL